MEPWDVTIVGGGILGTSFAYWLANGYDGRIAVVEKEPQVAAHTSRRNAGGVHRPFYLDPVGRRVFARSSQAAYGMWKAFAAQRGLPWSPVGTFEVATRPEQLSHLEKYRTWGLANGMGDDERALLTAEDVRRLEPHGRCYGAIWSKTDTALDYPAFTQALREEAERAGATFLLGSQVESIEVARDYFEVCPVPTAASLRAGRRRRRWRRPGSVAGLAVWSVAASRRSPREKGPGRAGGGRWRAGSGRPSPRQEWHGAGRRARPSRAFIRL